MKKTIFTSIEIAAKPEIIWNILTNFEKYPEWNPFIKAAKGDLKVGGRLEIQLPGMKFKPEVLTFNKNSELKWLGKLFFSGVFDGEHRFVLKDNGNGTTTFEHSESFNGILVGMFAKNLDTDTKSGFEAMNEKLKERAENF